jgi:colanic acid biosynthesis protein WcaH
MTQKDVSIGGTSIQLPAEEFKYVVKNAPLISIDLIIEDEAGRFLLGLRNNAPAKDYWFVPGGRVYKNERLVEALNRISLAELGRSLTLDDCRFLGMYEHFYEENAFSDEFGTHYVVAAFSLKVESLESLPDIQHSGYRWLFPEGILGDPNVHSHTKDYFLSSKGVRGDDGHL